MTERNEGDMSKQAWQSQPIDAPAISLGFVQHQAARLNTQFRREIRLLYSVVALGIVVALVALYSAARAAPTAMTLVSVLGVILAVGGFIYLALQARRRGSLVALRPEQSVADSLNAYRTELQRRRDYYLRSWRWSVGPLLPAAAVLLLGGVLFDARPQFGLRIGLFIALAVVFSLLGLFVHRRKARAFQEELDALDSMYRH